MKKKYLLLCVLISLPLGAICMWPHREKTCHRGFRPGHPPTNLLSYRDLRGLEILYPASLAIILSKELIT